jgi:hypothetical protein
MLPCEGFCSILSNIFLVIVAIVVVHFFYLLSNRNYWTSRGVFSPNFSALLGNLPGQVNGKRHIMYELDELYKKYKNSHAYVGIFNFRSPRLLIIDPEIVKDVMVKYFKAFQATEFYGRIDEKSDPLFGNHMFFQIGDDWKNTRQSISPAFTNNRVSLTFVNFSSIFELFFVIPQIKAVHPILVNVYEKMRKYIKNESGGSCGFDAKDVSDFL